MWKPMVMDDATGEVVAPNGSIGFRYGEEGWASGISTSVTSPHA